MWALSQTVPEATSSVKALVLKRPGEGSVETVPNPVAAPGELLLRVRMVGFCGSDLNSFCRRNPLITVPPTDLPFLQPASEGLQFHVLGEYLI